MSVSSEDAYSNEDISAVLEIASEPSYISEIARKLEEYYDDWGLSGSGSVEKVAITASMMEDRDDVDFYEVGYSDSDMGQSEASPIMSLTGQDPDGGYTWNQYTIMHYNTDAEIRDSFSEAVDKSVTPEDKIELIKLLSGSGNDISKQAEMIMQDCLERQFKHYDIVETPSYNDPGIDFYVEDERNRDWGLAVEISTRWVNPIDDPYLENKKEKAFEKDADLVILAPRFTGEMVEEYEDPKSSGWHEVIGDEMVHTHRVPTKEPGVYTPLATDPGDVNDISGGGNPIIVPDNSDAREMLSEGGNVGEQYPVVDSSYADFVDAIDSVYRDRVVITESQYRNEIREAIEPLLWEFLRPYKIEQFLVDTYWEKGRSQKSIGRLVDRASGTISDWMQKWGVMRRGTGAPELSDEIEDIWVRMYEGKEPFNETFSGYRILAEYNRHPLWSLDDWREYYSETTEDERQELIVKQDSYRDSLGYTLMFNPGNRLQPSYSFVLKTLKQNGVEIREPDEAPRGEYNAYPSKQAIEYMLNKNQNTVVDVSEDDSDE